MENGRAIEQGNHAVLMEQDGLYARLVRTQAFGVTGVPERGAAPSPDLTPPKAGGPLETDTWRWAEAYGPARQRLSGADGSLALNLPITHGAR